MAALLVRAGGVISFTGTALALGIYQTYDAFKKDASATFNTIQQVVDPASTIKSATGLVEDINK